MMCSFHESDVPWPPRGWTHLEHFKELTGQAIAKDPSSARVTGLTYHIDPLPVYRKNYDPFFVYSFQIDGWEYTINNESREYPVLSFLLREKPDPATPKEFYISEIKTNSRPLRITERSAHRVMTATLFLMKQISSNQVPDTERILRLYKIHPSQRSLYDIDNSRPDSLFCGLPYVEYDYEESESA